MTRLGAAVQERQCPARANCEAGEFGNNPKVLRHSTVTGVW